MAATAKKKAPRNVRDEAILVRVTPDTMDKAQEYATGRQWSLSHLGDVALKEYLANHAHAK